ncbi:hypothetical protein HKCCSP123_06245 [Rhodobacterales bacterium HKCCSP123]|nr:hypothetical protein [Rhodobacterales bacterium HKCCSP123]
MLDTDGHNRDTDGDTRIPRDAVHDCYRAVELLDRTLAGDALSAAVSRATAASGSDPSGQLHAALTAALSRLTNRIAAKGRALDEVRAMITEEIDDDAAT